MTVLQTERLVLREQTAEDADFVLELLNDPDFLRYIGDRGVRTPAEARAYIENGAVALMGLHGFSLYLVERRSDGNPIGVCGLLKRDHLDDPDIGFAFLPPYRGQGYASEAARATLDHAWKDHGLERLVAIVAPGNTASIRLLEHLGFTRDDSASAPRDDDVLVFSRDAPG